MDLLVPHVFLRSVCFAFHGRSDQLLHPFEGDDSAKLGVHRVMSFGVCKALALSGM